MQRFINNFSTELGAPLAAGGGVLQVDASQAARLIGLGGGDFYQLTLSRMDSNGVEVAWEIVRATAVSGGSVTVQREQEGTEALSWPAGSTVSARLTAGSMAAILQGYASLQEQLQDLSDRVSQLEDGGVPDNALTNQAGEVLANQAGEILTMGATA